MAKICEIVRSVVVREMPELDPIEVKTTPSDDLRSYHISSEKIRCELGFVPKRTIEDAVADLCRAFRGGRIPNSLSDSRYFNVKRVKEWMNERRR